MPRWLWAQLRPPRVDARIRRALCAALGIGFCIALSGCGRTGQRSHGVSITIPPFEKTKLPPPVSLAPRNGPAVPVPSSVIKRAMHSMVRIVCESGENEETGSGFLARTGVITAWHVVRGCFTSAADRRVTAYFSVVPRSAGLVVTRVNRLHDLALLGAGVLPEGHALSLVSTRLRVGERVALIGFPGGAMLL